MRADFYKENRDNFAAKMEPGSLALFFSGELQRKSSDDDYPWYPSRNFIYLTGIEQHDSVLAIYKYPEQPENGAAYAETLYILPKDFMAERWTGRRLSPEYAAERSGIKDISDTCLFMQDLTAFITKEHVNTVYLDIDHKKGRRTPVMADHMKEMLDAGWPDAEIVNSLPILMDMRLIKRPCEIEAMEIAEDVTKDGILAMMTHCRPGMYEYQLKSWYDWALAQRGVLEPGFDSIISAGKNNFTIHYYDYHGIVNDGDIVLNDVGARWDNYVTDVSRGWPANGRFNDHQKRIFEAQRRTSDYMFSILKPGIPMSDVDRIAHEYCFEQMVDLGICRRDEDVSKYMWHGGAHHVGMDVHDRVDAAGKLTAPGMVFCVDIGIYHEEWGEGFRLEDNCLITENGCRNLSAAIPRTIEDIEDVFK